MILQANLLELSSGSDGKLLSFINNGTFRVLPEIFAFANPMIPKSFKGQNQEVQLTGNSQQGKYPGMETKIGPR